MNTSIPRIDYAAAVTLWQLLLYNHSFEKSKMESITSIKIIMDLPDGVKTGVIEKIAQLMPIDLFFDGLLSYVYNDCMRDLMESISMSVEDIENPDLRHERENTLMELINDHIQDMVVAFRTALAGMMPPLYHSPGLSNGKWKVVAVAYDGPSEALAARLEFSDYDDDDGVGDATAIIDEENEEEDDDQPESEESEEEDESDEGSETDD